MNEKPKVSVILPAYKCKKYLFGAIDSILNQYYTDFELIVVLKLTPDDSNLINEISIRFNDSRITIIIQQDSGYAEAINLGYEYARGEYIAFQDCDDLSEPNRLLQEVTILDSDSEIELVYSPTLHLNDDDEPIGISGGLKPGIIMPDVAFYTLYLEGNFIQNPTVMFRKRHLLNDKLFTVDIKNSQDYDHNLRVTHDFPIFEIGTPLVRIRRGKNLGNMSSDIVSNFKSAHHILKRIRLLFASSEPKVSIMTFLRAYSNLSLIEASYYYKNNRMTESVISLIFGFICNPINKKILQASRARQGSNRK